MGHIAHLKKQCKSINTYDYHNVDSLPGVDPGILVRGGGVDFFFQRHEVWERLKTPIGSPEAPEF